MTLTKQSNVDRLGDGIDGAKTLRNINQAHAVVQHGSNVGVIEVRLLVVKGAEEIVVVFIDVVVEFAIFDFSQRDPAWGTTTGVNILLCTRHHLHQHTTVAAERREQYFTGALTLLTK